MSLIDTYAPIWPELVVAIGAMALLMYGVFRPDTQRDGEIAGWIAIAILAVAGFMVVNQPSAPAALFGDAFVVDAFARFMKVLTLVGSAAALLLSFDDFTDNKVMKFEYPVVVLLATAGMMTMISAGDLIALYLGLELQSLALYVAAAYRRDDVRSSEAGLKYFVLGALSSGMLLYGASLIYGFAGSTSFAVIAGVAKSAATGPSFGLVIGLVFLLVGLAFKVSAVPFHMWTPDVYEGAATPVTTFFAAAPKIAAMALLTRAMVAAFPGMAAQWQQIVSFMAIASMLLGAFAAIGQSNFKRLMAYSSIANVGFALVGLASNSVEGVQGVLVYMAIYLVMTLGTFACILSMRRKGVSVESIDELGGLASHNLPFAFTLAMLMFSLAGIPPLAGFFGKFYAFMPAIKAGLYPLAVIGVVASVIGAYYYLRIVKVMFFDEPKPAFEPVRGKAGAVMAFACLFVLAFVLPFVSAPIVDAAEVAAKSFRF